MSNITHLPSTNGSQSMPYIQPDVITVGMWPTLDSASPSIPLTDDIISGYR